jgi:hypothetical protein
MRQVADAKEGLRPKHVSYKWSRDTLGEERTQGCRHRSLLLASCGQAMTNTARARETQGAVHKKMCTRSPRRCLCAKTDFAIGFDNRREE